MFEKSSACNRSSSRDANYQQYRQALRYRFDRCSLGTDRADVTGSPTRRPTTHNQHSRCVKRNLLSTTNRLPMAFASPRVSSVEHRLSLLPSLEEPWCLDLRPALNVPASSTASRSDRRTMPADAYVDRNAVGFDLMRLHRRREGMDTILMSVIVHRFTPNLKGTRSRKLEEKPMLYYNDRPKMPAYF
jgi:hypothetical protein